MRHASLTTAVATLLLVAAATTPARAQDQDRERCYGVAPAGAADGVGEDEAPGAGEVDYQGNAWIWVPVGSCLMQAAPVQADGTPRRGSLEPLERDLP